MVLLSWTIVQHVRGHAVDNAVWAIETSIALALIGWSAGPRLAQYLFPSIGSVAASASQAIKRPFGPREQDVA